MVFHGYRLLFCSTSLIVQCNGDINLRPSYVFHFVADGKHDQGEWEDDKASDEDDGNVAANLIFVIRLWKDQVLATA